MTLGPYNLLTFHLHDRGEWCEFFANPFHPGNVADVLREHLQPARIMIRELSGYSVPVHRRFWAILKERRIAHKRVSRGLLVAGGRGLEALDAVHPEDLSRPGLGCWWSEAPASELDCRRAANVIARTRGWALKQSQLDQLAAWGTRFVYLDHDGDRARLWLRFARSGPAFAAYAIRNFLLNDRSKGAFERVAKAYRADLDAIRFSVPDRRFADALASYSVDGVVCRVRDIALRRNTVTLKSWRGHLRFLVDPDNPTQHPLLSEMNQSFDVRYDGRRDSWSLSAIRKERCPFKEPWEA